MPDWSLETGTIAGDEIMPFLTEGLKGFDINDPGGLVLAEHLVATGEAHSARGHRRLP